MRSRRDDIDPRGALDRAQALGLCGFGGHDDPVRLARRIERFADVADGESVDLVHVRPCEWLTDPMAAPAAPAAVVATFGRGGRSFQRIHDAAVGDESARLWVSPVSGRSR